MDNDFFLQHLRDLSLEEGRVFIQEHAAELTDHAAFGELVAEEALHQRDVNPFLSLKLSELLIFFGEYLHHLPSHALGLKAKGDALSVVGHEQAAMDCLDSAGEEFLALGDEVNWARSRIAWIVSCAWIGRAEEALQEAARARAVFLLHGEDYWACVIDHNTAVIYSQIGQYRKALELYERMLAIYPTLTDKSEALIRRAIAIAQMNQGRNLSWLGNFEEAYHLIEQAQASFIALEQTGFIISTELNLADLDYAQGYYGSALRRYYQARDRLIEKNFDSPILFASTALKIAVCLVKLNRVQEACHSAAKAVEVYRQVGTSLETGDALREYATILVASSRWKEALAALEEAWMVFTQGGLEHHASTTRLQQAELLLEMGATTEAYEQAHLIKQYFIAQGLVSRAARASLVMAGALIEYARQIELGQPDLLQDAELLCEQVANQANQHDLQEQSYKSQYLLGQLAIIQRDLVKAAKHYSAAIAQIEQMLDNLVHDFGSAFLNTTWTVYEDMIALCLQQEQFESAFSYLEQARSVVLRQYLNKSRAFQSESNEHVSSSNLSKLATNNATALQMQHEFRRWQQAYHDYSALLADIDASVSPSVNREVVLAELKRCEEKVNELFERLQLHQLDTHSPLQKSHYKGGKRTERSARSVNVPLLRQQLWPNQLLLAYFLYKGRLVIFATTSEQLITHEIPDGAVQLERLLPLLHAHLQPSGWPDIKDPPQQAVRRLLKKLYDLLIAPVASLLPSKSGFLTIVPYGPLHKLPFHALYDGMHFLIENFQINYLPASNLLLHLDTHKNKQVIPAAHSNGDTTSEQTERRLLRTSESSRPPLVFGYSGNGHLKRVLDEAKRVATLLSGSCYVESEASIARLIEQAAGSPIIHIATHGQSRMDLPNFSYIQLADGQFNALDAFSLNLKDCELVTLSGCETGLALSGGGDEQLGLGRAFLAAGAASLVMSLWSVEDSATNELMQLFYQHLLRGATKAQALQAAQCSLLQNASSSYAHPYFWSAFRLVGDIDPLTSKGLLS